MTNADDTILNNYFKIIILFHQIIVERKMKIRIVDWFIDESKKPNDHFICCDL